MSTNKADPRAALIVLKYLLGHLAQAHHSAAHVLSFNRGDDRVYPYDCDPSCGLSMEAIEGPAD